MLRMKQIRKEQGLSQSGLSKLSGVHVSTISNIETGRLSPWPGQRLSIAHALGWPEDRADQLFESAALDAVH